MNVGWCVVEVGKMGSDQLLYGPEGSNGFDGLDVPTGEVPVYSPPRTSVLADDGPRSGGPTETAVSIHLQTDELPFQQPSLQTVPVEPAARGWRATIVEAGRWPLMALGAAAVLVIVFAGFIFRNGRSPSGDSEATEPPSVVESASAAATADQLAGTPAQAQLGSDPLTPGEESDDSARSTGRLGPGEGSGFFSGQTVEPDRSLTGADVDWTPTTETPSTTATTPSTAASSSTVPDSTTTVPSTSTTATTPEPSGPWVRAIGPGSADAKNPASVGSGRVTLQAEGSNESMRYRFFVFVGTDDGDWRQVQRSRWRWRSSWTIDVDRYEGRTIRWTVVGVSGFRNLTDESAPLYLRVGGGDTASESNDDGSGNEGEPEPDADASLTDG